jgi:tetratricopeptide (TPR) repeat protein
LAQLEKARQVFEKMLGFDMDCLQRSNILRKAGDNFLEILKIRGEQQTAEQAISCYETALQTYSADRHPIFRAMTLRGLGFAYAACADWRDRSACLKRAVSCWEEALSHYSISSAPQDYVCIQEGLGRTYRKLAEMEKRKDNAARAARACQKALALCSEEDCATQYAGLMADLGSSYLMLAQAEGRRDNCRRAIESYRKAMQVYTAMSYPQQYASMQNNLAIAYLSLADLDEEQGGTAIQARGGADGGSETGAEGREEGGLRIASEGLGESRADYCLLAVAACKEALIYRTAEQYPLAYAATENNLGNAYFALSEEGGAASDSLREAHDAFSRALQVYSKEKHPRQYATTQNNLANVYLAWRTATAGEEGEAESSGEGLLPINCLKAIRAAEEALSVFTFDESPEDYSEAQGTLWLAYLTLADYEFRAENCALALDACQARLSALRASGSQAAVASCCKDLAITASIMADLEESVQAKALDCNVAVAAAKEALKHFNSVRYPAEHAETQILLWAAYSALAEVEDGPINCRKAIRACRGAISIYEESSPTEHADARKSLGYSLVTLAEMEGGADAAGNCEKAIEAYRLALEHYTLEKHPIDHADILRDLAYAYVALSAAAEIAPAEDICKDALRAYRSAQRIYQARAEDLYRSGEWAEAALMRELAAKCQLSMQSCKAIIKAGRKRAGAESTGGPGG